MSEKWRGIFTRKREHVIPLRLNKKELSYLNKQVDVSRMPREEYLRTLILNGEVRARPCAHHADLLRKVAGLCNNANQLAHVANSTGQAGQQSVDEMIRLAREVWQEVKARW